MFWDFNTIFCSYSRVISVVIAFMFVLYQLVHYLHTLGVGIVVLDVGIEPTGLSQQIYSLPPRRTGLIER
jgi:hypothetical protein